MMSSLLFCWSTGALHLPGVFVSGMVVVIKEGNNMLWAQ